MTLRTAELAEEGARGRIAGAATIAAGTLIAGGTVWDAFVNRDRPDGKNDDAERIHFFDDHSGELIAANGLRSLGFLLLVLAVVHFHRTTRARNPELPSVPIVIGLFGVITLALGIVGRAVALGTEAADFVTRDFATKAAADKAAEDAVAQGMPLITGVLAFTGTIAISFWFVLASLNAMRVGLLTRFMGVLGIIVGAGFIFGFAPPVMVLWLIAVGVLFLGYWPRGLPPAWEAGEARPWPGREQPQDAVDAEVEAIGSSRNGEVEAVGPGVRGPESEAQPKQPPGTSRRKRKRRR
jgi:hypothetical protein